MQLTIYLYNYIYLYIHMHIQERVYYNYAKFILFGGLRQSLPCLHFSGITNSSMATIYQVILRFTTSNPLKQGGDEALYMVYGEYVYSIL